MDSRQSSAYPFARIDKIWLGISPCINCLPPVARRTRAYTPFPRSLRSSKPSATKSLSSFPRRTQRIGTQYSLVRRPLTRQTDQLYHHHHTLVSFAFSIFCFVSILFFIFREAYHCVNPLLLSSEPMTMAQPAPTDNPPAPHPLQFKWTLWHDVAEKKSKGPYAANLREVASFDTVEDFWA